MTLFTREERRRSRRLDPTSRIALLSLSLLLILSEASSAAAAADASRWSPARKTRLFAASPYLTGPTGPASKAKGRDEAGSSIDEEEKRVVHTGPNPLHN